jgi:hypothetical protein
MERSGLRNTPDVLTCKSATIGKIVLEMFQKRVTFHSNLPLLVNVFFGYFFKRIVYKCI